MGITARGPYTSGVVGPQGPMGALSQVWALKTKWSHGPRQRRTLWIEGGGGGSRKTGQRGCRAKTRGAGTACTSCKGKSSFVAAGSCIAAVQGDVSKEWQ